MTSKNPITKLEAKQIEQIHELKAEIEALKRKEKQTYVYEAVDQTDDEVFFPVGIWLTLAEAEQAILANAETPEELDDNDSSRYGLFNVNIHMREIGFYGIGLTVHMFEWEQRYIESDDSYTWYFKHKRVNENLSEQRKQS